MPIAITISVLEPGDNTVAGVFSCRVVTYHTIPYHTIPYHTIQQSKLYETEAELIPRTRNPPSPLSFL